MPYGIYFELNNLSIFSLLTFFVSNVLFISFAVRNWLQVDNYTTWPSQRFLVVTFLYYSSFHFFCCQKLVAGGQLHHLAVPKVSNGNFSYYFRVGCYTPVTIKKEMRGAAEQARCESCTKSGTTLTPHYTRL